MVSTAGGTDRPCKAAVGHSCKLRDAIEGSDPNVELGKTGRPSLLNEGVRDALHRLEKLRSVELVEEKENTWRIVEKYEIK